MHLEDQQKFFICVFYILFLSFSVTHSRSRVLQVQLEVRGASAPGQTLQEVRGAAAPGQTLHRSRSLTSRLPPLNLSIAVGRFVFGLIFIRCWLGSIRSTVGGVLRERLL